MIVRLILKTVCAIPVLHERKGGEELSHNLCCVIRSLAMFFVDNWTLLPTRVTMEFSCSTELAGGTNKLGFTHSLAPQSLSWTWGIRMPIYRDATKPYHLFSFCLFLVVAREIFVTAAIHSSYKSSSLEFKVILYCANQCVVLLPFLLKLYTKNRLLHSVTALLFKKPTH